VSVLKQNSLSEFPKKNISEQQFVDGHEVWMWSWVYNWSIVDKLW